MEGKAGKPPNFALLIGKRLDGKPGGPKEPPGMGSESEDDGGGDKQHQMCLSAVSDLIAAIHSKDPEAAEAALGDYLSLKDEGGDESEEPAEEPAEEPESAA
jgi:hypothetical protein